MSKKDLKLTKRQEFLIKQILDLYLNTETEGRNTYEDKEFRKNYRNNKDTNSCNTNNTSDNTDSNIPGDLKS